MMLVQPHDPILLTGATGFIGSRVVAELVERGFHNLRVLAGPSSQVAHLRALCDRHPGRPRLEIVSGNLLSRDDCLAATKNVALVLHLAAARGEKSFPNAFMNSVVTTRNLLDASLRSPGLRRFVNVGSFAVYSNTNKSRCRLLDESCPTHDRPDLQGSAYAYAKQKQDELVVAYGERYSLPYVIVRPGYIVECAQHGTISAVMDSERAAAIVRDRGMHAGLHLNFTTPFSAPGCSRQLWQAQQAIGRYLRRHRLAQVLFHPGLARPFEQVVTAQLAEFQRLYGSAPHRIDGHHHMHLCANVLLEGLLPLGTVVRRNFSFQAGEKGAWNRLYRRLVDRLLGRRHRLADFLFSLSPLEPPDRLGRILALARDFVVEVETHPIAPQEHGFLVSGEIFRCTPGLEIAPPSVVARFGRQRTGNDS
jgi:nucleoside-diphosphate-sugar epimerase